MDVSVLIKQRLEELNLEQRDLAAAARVTESYISQLLTGKKLPPAPDRTDIYMKMSKILKLPSDKLARLAELQRMAASKQSSREPLAPLLKDVRELVLRKCAPDQEGRIRAIFEKQPFGELERLVTQRLSRRQNPGENWKRNGSRWSLMAHEAKVTNAVILGFLDTISACRRKLYPFLDPINPGRSTDFGGDRYPGLRACQAIWSRRRGRPAAKTSPIQEFLHTRSLPGREGRRASSEEAPVQGKRPTALYYYRELQNLRDPLHFRSE
jgi:transcriptional regulator with XRE-family HTH domain